MTSRRATHPAGRFTISASAPTILRRWSRDSPPRGVPFRRGIREFGSWRYIMCAGPDDVLLELFEAGGAEMTPELAEYFGDGTAAQG